jgi:rhodanese-related sulfurtransferase
MANSSLNRPSLPRTSTTRPECISAQDLADQLGSRGVTVIDVREPMEYASGHIAGACARALPPC